MRFNYRAAGADGKVVEGSISADKKEQAFAALLAQKLYPIRLDAESSAAAPPASRRKKGSSAELSEGMAELSKLLQAGLPLLSAVTEMESLAESAAFREAWADVKEQLRGGTALSKALASRPECFPALVVGMAAAGEESGQLSIIFDRLSKYLDEMRMLRSELMSALVYPVVMLVVGLACVFFLVFFVLPRFAAMFEEMQTELPLPTRVLLGASAELKSHGLWVAILVAGAGFYCWKRYQEPAVRENVHRVVLRVPLIGDLWQKIEAARIARTTSALLAGGLPVLRALDILKDIVQNLAMRSKVAESLESVRVGRSLSESLDSPLFPGLLLRMIAVGENAGNLPEMLDRAAEVFEGQVRTKSKALISLLEPLMIVGLAGAVGFIFAAVLLPMMKMGGH